MRTQLRSCLLLLLALSITASGQVKTQVELEIPYIEVTGTAEKEVVPDEIYITIVIKERHEVRDEVTIEEQEEELRAAIDRVGVSLDNLSLSDANANYRRIRWTKKDLVTRTEYVLKVKDAMTIGKLFDELEELDIENAYIAKVTHSEIDRFRKEVRIGAIEAAKDKADYLLTAIDAQTGRPLTVKEDHVLPISELRGVNARMAQNYYLHDDIDYGSYKSGTDKVAISYQKIKLRASVYVKFEIQ